MKKVAFLLLIISVNLVAFAQDSIYVLSRPNYLKTYSISSIDSLTIQKPFVLSNDTLLIHLNGNTSIVKYPTNTLDSIIFSAPNKFSANTCGFFPENNFLTQQDALTGVSSIYKLLNNGGTSCPSIYNSLLNIGLDFEVDDIDPGPGTTNPVVRAQALLSFNSSGLNIAQIWYQHYNGVGNANIALQKIPKINFDSALKSRLLAEAKFLRALYYFNLVRIYGDVPLWTDFNGSLDTLSRTPSSQVYTQIVQDLQDASNVLPVSYTGLDIGRATQGAALALLSKVYLTQASLPLNLTSNYASAVNTAELVISTIDGGSGAFGYSLRANYPDVFSTAFKNNEEHIFSAQFKASSSSPFNTSSNIESTRETFSGVPGLFGSYADQVRYYTVGNDKYYSIYKLYKKTDKRITVDAFGNGAFRKFYVSPTNGNKYTSLNAITVVSGITIGDTVPFLNKYWDANNVTNLSQSASNVPIIRYAEVLLIHAEAENELNGPTAKAYNSINIVRNRAGLPNLTPGLTQNQFRDSVYLERRLELVYEYNRWFDLVRERDDNGNSIFVSSLLTVGKTNAASKDLLLPIPAKAIRLNPKLTQNPGY